MLPGTAPNCQLIARTTELSPYMPYVPPTVTPNVNILPNHFSDEFFGTDRLMTGLLTNYVINATKPISGTNIPIEDVRAVVFTLQLDTSLFNEFHDVITLYEGGKKVEIYMYYIYKLSLLHIFHTSHIFHNRDVCV